MDILSDHEQHMLLRTIAPHYIFDLPADVPRPAPLHTSGAWKCARNLTAALLMLDAGLRVAEVTKLCRIDCFFALKPVQTLTLGPLVAKGRRPRTIPLTTRLRNVLAYFVPEFLLVADWPLTQKLISRWPQGPPISTRQLYNIILLAGVAALNKPIHPHQLRHTYATRLMHVTDLRTVQELLGHKKIATTQIYTHVNNLDKTKAIEAMEQAPTSPPLELESSRT